MKIILFCILFLSFPLIHNYSSETDTGEIIQQFGEKIKSIRDYQCRMYEWSINGRKEEIRYINFYFHSPRLIRMDIIKGNKDSDAGSIGVLSDDGQVKGRRGGFLSGIAITVAKHSRLATTVRGVTFDESDAIAAYIRLIFLKDNSTINLEESPEGWLLDCTLYTPDNGITREEIYISRNNLMPAYAMSYENENLVQHVEWSSYIINSGLPVDFFDVWYDAENLNQLNISNNLNLPLDIKK